MSSTSPNRLSRATSPYLLQHAHNPVDWFEWGPEALTKAKKEDKPILVSIGYSSCHWCHVMERESFENNAVADVMNKHFVCIKVDREERPDIDQIYMEAVQAMQQHGGWPLNVFLTPDQKPFFGGTYFPRENWIQLLIQVERAFREKRKEIDESGESLRQHLQTSDLQRFTKEAGLEKFKGESLDKMFQILVSRFDNEWGGIEKAPKFVMPTIWLFLLRYYAWSGNREALGMVILTLRKMSMGGMYDQIGGGFSRYSVDREWFAPHFEKMLYDNAQLLSLYSETYSASKEDALREIVFDTIAWLEREMTHADGGFYSALDADSEGVEGKFYTWTWDELNAISGNDESVSRYFGATPEGNWEHGRNILIKASDDALSKEALQKVKNQLLTARSERIRPSLDDKILTGWNAMTIKGLTDAYKTFGEERFLALAIKNIEFLESHSIENGKVFRAFKNKHSETEGFLEDYAFIIQAYISLYQVTFNEGWLSKAARWTNYVLDQFFDKNEKYFTFSSASAEKLIAQKKEIFDNVIPSANSVMARNLFHLGILTDNESWRKTSIDMTAALASIIETEPGYTSNWGMLYSEINKEMAEIVVMGPEALNIRKELHGHFLPFAVVSGSTSGSDLPLLKGREPKGGKTLIYVCYNKTCQLPVETVEKALEQIR